MTLQHIAASLSYTVCGLTALAAIAAVPFILFAGVGLLGAAPFGWFSYKELPFAKMIGSGLIIERTIRRQRLICIAACIFGAEAVLGLLWFTNSVSHVDGSFTPILHSQATISLVVGSAVVCVLAGLMIIPQVIYKK